MKIAGQLFALLVFSISSSAAFADDKLYCLMQDLKGNKVEYLFVKTDNYNSSEVLFKKNGAIVRNVAPPSWRIAWDDTNFWLIPQDTPDYTLIVGKLHYLDAASDLRGADAVISRMIGGKRHFVSKGICGTKFGTWRVAPQDVARSAPTQPIPSPLPTQPYPQQPPAVPSTNPSVSQATNPDDAASVFLEGAGLPHQ